MLAEFDPFQWDWLLFILGCAGLVGLYFWRRKKLRENARASLDTFPTDISNVVLTFWNDENLKPLPAEVSLANKVFRAARASWPELVDRLSNATYNIWFVRDPNQRVGWRQYGGIRWKDIPSVGQIPANDPDSGYGGLSSDSNTSGTAWAATFFTARSPEALLAHEVTHCVTRIHNDAAGNHPDEFVEFEKRLKAKLEKL